MVRRFGQEGRCTNAAKTSRLAELVNSNGYIHRPPSTLDYDKKYIGQHYLAETLYRFLGQPAFGMTVGVPEEGVEVILQLNIVPPILRKQ